ncbi:alpha/beta hydrolase [Carboxylicivirga sediminis]|uniref:Alpha/beta hydrolase n=1 Tax=Carboxylicivirga sediminis TaxID=2006564 RepID=A0A941F1T3_9BACT|nr:alpha/beta hydrolase [Carboxylicivirga sediminis]MBR8534774.1 alpha/beta hydrolase [Carboxylicivirga sediminis]
MKTYLLVFLMTFSLINGYGQSTKENIYGSNLEIGKYATINGNKIYYETYGQGTPLLLLHGGLGSISNFMYSIPTFSEHFKVIAIDSPGHGRSSHVDSLSYPYLTERISEFIDYLKLDSLYILGFSDGAVVGLQLAADRPDKVRKLIAIGANIRLDALSEGSINWMRNDMIEWAKNKDGWWSKNILPLLEEPERSDIYLENTKKMWLTKVYVEDKKVQSIKIPTMIMQGDKDGIKNEHAVELSNYIENSQLCILPNTNHYVFGSKPKMVNQIAIDFFNEK